MTCTMNIIAMHVTTALHVASLVRVASIVRVAAVVARVALVVCGGALVHIRGSSCVE